MPTALYYPHTTIRDKALLRNALLLWDTVECVTPSFGKRPHYFGDAKWDEATQLVVRDRVPTDEERRAVHDMVQRLVERGLSEWPWIRQPLSGYGHHPYFIYPEKLAAETWHLLEDIQLATWRADGDAQVSGPFGLLVMSLLADACAGTQKRKITDRVSAYNALSQCLTASAGGEYLTGVAAGEVPLEYDRLVSVSVKVLDTDEIPVDRLLELRRRERRDGTMDYWALRKRYIERLELCAKRLATEARTLSDRYEIERDFEHEMRDDLATLRSELRLSKLKALLTKEVIVGAAVIAGALVADTYGLMELGKTLLTPISIGALVLSGCEHEAARHKALRNHAMSWLYLARPPHVRVIARTE